MKLPVNSSRLQWSLLIVWMIVVTSCNTMKDGLFGKKSPHERYARLLEQSGLANTSLGTRWLAEADSALENPVAIELPYRESGYFPAEDPSAYGFHFLLRRGELVVVTIQVNPARSANIFFDIWEKTGGKDSRLLAASDSSQLEIRHEVGEDGEYLLRVQPELLSALEYTLTINTAPSLAFPVSPENNPRVQSYWGADRDGGARSHEGIDIFAPRSTPALAISNGRVTRVNENRLGGKVVFMRPEGKNYSVYYAHLDSQLVREGQQVRVGEAIGLIGNTGNARTTPPHLHLGIYSTAGAVDPYPFVNNNRSPVPEVKAAIPRVNSFGRNTSSTSLGESLSGIRQTLQPNSLFRIVAASADQYRVETPDGSTGFIGEELVSTNPYSGITLSRELPLFDNPDSAAARKTILEPGTKLSVIGKHGVFQLVKANGLVGWIKVEGLSR